MDLLVRTLEKVRERVEMGVFPRASGYSYRFCRENALSQRIC